VQGLVRKILTNDVRLHACRPQFVEQVVSRLNRLAGLCKSCKRESRVDLCLIFLLGKIEE
jgi:hypothetical protein